MLKAIYEWWVRRIEAHHIKRGTFDQYRENYIVNKRKTLWRYSGVSAGQNNFYTDLGVLVSETEMNRAQAMRYFKKNFPENATILHIDDRHKIVTYRVK